MQVDAAVAPKCKDTSSEQSNDKHSPSLLESLQQRLPPQWSAAQTGTDLHLSLHSKDPSRVVQRSLVVSMSGQVTAFAHGHQLSRQEQIPPYDPCNPQEFAVSALKCLQAFRELEICIGASKEGGKVWWKRNLDSCHIDNNLFHESRYATTLRSNNCHYLIGQRMKMCSNCYRVNRQLTRRKKPTDQSATKKTPDKSKPFKHLSSAEKDARSRRQAKHIRNLNKKIARLKLQINNLISSEGTSIDKKLDDSLGQALERELDSMKKKNSNDEKDRFLQVFLEQQIAARDAKGNQGIIWHPLMIRFALQLKHCSQSSLTASRNFIRLPSDRLLWDYTHIYDVEPGIKEEFISETAEKVKNMKYPYQSYHVLLFDEMNIKENIVQRKKTGQIVGYCKLSEVQTELAELRAKLEAEAEGGRGVVPPTPAIAKKILSYMVRGTSNDIQTCVASYPVNSLTREDLHQYTWDVTEALETAGIKIVAFVADGSPANRSFFEMHPPAENGKTSTGLVFKTTNPFDISRCIFFIPDPPHALKTARNCLHSSGRKKSRHMFKNGQRMTWAAIIRLYKWKSEQTIKKLPRLTAACVYLNSYSRMSVPFACRVCSHSVSTQLQLLGWPDTSELSIFATYE